MTTSLTLFWEGKGWWPWSYTDLCLEMILFLWERKGVIVAIGILRRLGKERGGCHGQTQPSAEKFTSSSGKGTRG